MFIPASGRLADRFGSRTVFRAAIGMFTLGSIACAQAPSLAFLVAARMLQGAGGAMMSPGWPAGDVARGVEDRPGQGDGLADDSRHDRAYRRSAGWRVSSSPTCRGTGSSTSTYPSASPVSSWSRATSRTCKEPTRTPFDLRGLLLAGTALASLMFSIELASRGVGSSAVAPGLFGLGAVAAALYVPHARHHPRPMLDFRMLRIPTFRYSVICGSLSRVAVGAMPFLLPMMLQLGFGLSAAQQRVDHLCQFGRLAGDAAYRAGISAPAWLSQRADLGRADRHAVACADRCIPAELADRALIYHRAVAQRVFPVAAIHGLQHDRLCRRAATADEHGDQFLHDVPADVADTGHRGIGGCARRVH